MPMKINPIILKANTDTLNASDNRLLSPEEILRSAPPSGYIIFQKRYTAPAQEMMFRSRSAQALKLRDANGAIMKGHTMLDEGEEYSDAWRP